MQVGEIAWTVLIGLVVVGAVGYSLSIYNSLVALKNNIGRSWANIDVLLKQRHDELPKLVKTCGAYMQHEREAFGHLSEARGALMMAKSIEQRAEAENLLTRALVRFFAVAEGYPDLRANLSFLQIQSRISDVENQIADRRDFYNDTVTTFNTRVGQMPDALFARWLGLSCVARFEMEDADREDQEIKFAMAS